MILINKLVKKIYKKFISNFIIPEFPSKIMVKLIFDYTRIGNILRFGFCPLCGKKNFMVLRGNNLRESGFCLYCSANSRYKAVSEIIKRILIIKASIKGLNYKKLKVKIEKFNLFHYSLERILNLIKHTNLKIYEPSSIGAIYNVLKFYPYFIKSEYFPNPDLTPGDLFKGIRFEDLQSLTFKNESFDIVITLDVFEHIQDPDRAFSEIYRVLKPKGINVFTVPFDNRKKTIKRIDKNNNVLIKPVIYHADSIRSKGPIVYTDWGHDIIDYMNKFGFSSFIFSLKDPQNGIFGEVEIVISIKE